MAIIDVRCHACSATFQTSTASNAAIVCPDCGAEWEDGDEAFQAQPAATGTRVPAGAVVGMIVLAIAGFVVGYAALNASSTPPSDRVDAVGSAQAIYDERVAELRRTRADRETTEASSRQQRHETQAARERDAGLQADRERLIADLAQVNEQQRELNRLYRELQGSVETAAEELSALGEQRDSLSSHAAALQAEIARLEGELRALHEPTKPPQETSPPPDVEAPREEPAIPAGRELVTEPEFIARVRAVIDANDLTLVRDRALRELAQSVVVERVVRLYDVGQQGSSLSLDVYHLFGTTSFRIYLSARRADEAAAWGRWDRLTFHTIPTDDCQTLNAFNDECFRGRTANPGLPFVDANPTRHTFVAYFRRLGRGTREEALAEIERNLTLPWPETTCFLVEGRVQSIDSRSGRQANVTIHTVSEWFANYQEDCGRGPDFRHTVTDPQAAEMMADNVRVHFLFIPRGIDFRDQLEFHARLWKVFD